MLVVFFLLKSQFLTEFFVELLGAQEHLLQVLTLLYVPA